MKKRTYSREKIREALAFWETKLQEVEKSIDEAEWLPSSAEIQVAEEEKDDEIIPEDEFMSVLSKN